MKNKLIRIISAVMAAGVLLGTYGCKKSETANENGKATEANPSAVSEEASAATGSNKATTVVEYTSVDANKKEVQATKVVEYDTRAFYNVVRSGETFKEQMDNDKNLKENIKKHIDNYNIDEKQYEEVVKKAEHWVSFEYNYLFVNTTPTRITFDRLSHTNADGIILNDYCIGCERGIASAQDGVITLEGFYDESKYPDEQAFLDALSKMSINVVYLPIENIDQTISDFENPQFKTLPIKITK